MMVGIPLAKCNNGNNNNTMEDVFVCNSCVAYFVAAQTIAVFGDVIVQCQSMTRVNMTSVTMVLLVSATPNTWAAVCRVCLALQITENESMHCPVLGAGDDAQQVWCAD
jgi:hypothetical protein